MRLRERLALNTFIALAIGVTGIYEGTDLWRRLQADRTLSDAIEAAATSDGRARCEAQPAAFGGGDLQPLPPVAFFGPMLESRPQIFAYDASFRSAHPSAPPFPQDLRAALAAGGQRAGGTFAVPFGVGRQLAVQMSWREGPCAILLSRFGGFIIPVSMQVFRGALVVLVVVGAGLFSAGPIIARIRRLTSAVNVSADSKYAIGVPVTRLDEIGQLEQAFNRAGEQVRIHVATIEEREATLRSVVSNTAHDVAIPLTVVQGHLSTLQSVLPSDSPAQDGLRGAIRETHYLAALLHNLGAAARLENPMTIVERRPLDLNALVERVVARHSPLAATLNVELGVAVPEQPVQVSADVTLLEQATGNLVHNAVHYNKPGGHVAVILETADHGLRFSLRVIDDGPGIPLEERAQLTDRTFRGAAGRARRPEGQGLGLHIVREVVDRHGFDLRFGESEYGGVEVEIDGPCSFSGLASHGGLGTR